MRRAPELGLIRSVDPTSPPTVSTDHADSDFEAVRRDRSSSDPSPTTDDLSDHSQRRLTVVKAGSIQDLHARPTDKVNTWPHLLVGEFVASIGCLALLVVLSTFVNSPLQGMANYNETPNPSKAPWYFLGLQELLSMLHPMVAGVMIPGIGLVVLATAPFLDRNPSHLPDDRKVATSLFSIFLMFWAVLTIIGSMFRGPGQNFVLPWRDGIFFEL
jgi:menaquinol-cytochrome c reductase cytochrome b/c subunit